MKRKLFSTIILAIAIWQSLSFAYAQDFTFGTIPDTQNLTENDADAGRIMDITGWYVGQRENLNIKFVASLGDMTQWGAHSQWQRVRRAYNLFKNDNLPYAPCQGNHDPQLDRFNQYFPQSEFIGNSTFGGNLNGGMENAYYLFSEAGMDFIVVVIQSHDNHIGHYNRESIDWANSVLTQYSDRRAIFVTHDFYEEKGLINDVIKKHDNLFLAVCGHSCRNGGEYRWTEKTPGGNTVQCIMSDYQCQQGNKAAILRYYTFKPDENKVYAYTYDAKNKRYLTGSSSQFSFDYNMESSSCDKTQRAFQGNIGAIPGTIEAENYNEGCEGEAFKDNSSSNLGGEYRNDGVDIEICNEGGYNVGWTQPGEWLNYEVKVSQTGSYSFDFRVASDKEGGEFHIEANGQDITGPVSVGNTGGWQSWTNISAKNVLLSAGKQNITLVIDAGEFNINSFSTTYEGGTGLPEITNVQHSPLTPAPNSNISISASISGDAAISEAKVFWGLSSSNLTNEVQMSSNGNQYSALIPGQPANTTVYYEIKATDINNNSTASTQSSITISGESGPKLIWSDEFNYTGVPDPSKWKYFLGPNPYNNEWQYYTKRTQNVRVENGVLVLEARKDYGGDPNREYSSGRIETKDVIDWRYGHFEIRAKLPGGKGTWAAIWMLPSDKVYGNWPKSGEIDIMENVGYQPQTVYGTVHTEAYNHMIGTQLGGEIDRSTYQTEFHTYAIDWTEDKIDFMMDGNIYFTHERHGGSAEWPFDQDFYLILNLAVGGDWGGALGVDPNIWPQRMEIDYVRVYDQTFGESTANIPGIIEAEDYYDSFGVKKENCDEGGQNVGYISDADWMIYKVNVAKAGDYRVEYRVASLNGGGVLNLEKNSGKTVLGSVNINTTGGWQNWTTVSNTIHLDAGEQTIGIGVPSGGFNINWMKFTLVADNPVQSIHIEAEDYSYMDGIKTEACSEGGENIGWTTKGDWLIYDQEISAGTYNVSYRVASMYGGGRIQLEKQGGGTVYGTTDIDATGGWQNWSTVTQQITIDENLSKIAIAIREGGFNLNYFDLIPVSSSSKSSGFGSGLTRNIEVSEPKISPNPVKYELTISDIDKNTSQLIITGLDGITYRTISLNNQSRITLDLSSLDKGLYIIYLKSETENKVYKFFKE
ncbi:carbohydrate-binding protein [Marinigracilibium pacificum]|uniref:Carbohydrate-binding protein n=1 Tax=Marinigracilibium pacificum TaxID=2729599 RepID=A0A848J3T0_9BACT|nr:carbohydrate-binding protein [Marinigracilibium pacificum]NMM47832.1 carbohydrate-binding protein [Marinigracilibium pacificum]